jgi:REP element-mobilizing transposase RayT
MAMGTPRHHRRLIHLQGYDYSQAGAYFVTTCAKNRVCLFGDVSNGSMRLNDWGHTVEEAWFDLPNHCANVRLGAFVVMPNHIHGIVVIVGAGFKPAPTNKPVHALSEIIRGFKTFSARRINMQRRTPGISVWQRNHYEHVIRSAESLCRIENYIFENPLRWMVDRENPDAEMNLKEGDFDL